MKKVYLIICFVLVAFAASAQIKAGGGFVYGSEVEEFGITFDGEFFLTDQLAISPDLSYFFVDDGPFDKYNFWAVNANVNYYFFSEGVASLYGIGGLNLATVSIESGTFDDSQTELGLNLGIGSGFDIGSSIEPFAEFKFVLSDYDQAVLGFGVRYKFE